MMIHIAKPTSFELIIVVVLLMLHAYLLHLGFI